MTSIRLAGRTGGEMWTDAHRARHEAGVKEMVTRDSVEEMAHWLERADPAASDKVTDDTQVVAGIAWHLRVGGGWRALPASSRAGAPSMAGSAAGARRVCLISTCERSPAGGGVPRGAARPLVWASSIPRR